MQSGSREVSASGEQSHRSQGLAVASVRAIGWIAVVVGVLVLAVRFYRAAVEGVHSISWGAILFLAPLAEITLGLFWIRGAALLQRKQWRRAASFVVGGILLTIAGFVLTNWLYDRFEGVEENQVESSAWVEFSVPTTSISVDVPHRPRLEKYEVDSVIGKIPVNMYFAEQGTVVFMIGVCDYPHGTVDSLKSKGKDFLVHMSDAAIASRTGSKLLDRRPIELEHWIGVEERVEMPAGRTDGLSDQPIIARQRYYQSAGRMIQLRVTTLKSIYSADVDAFERTATRFFQSIRTELSG